MGENNIFRDHSNANILRKHFTVIVGNTECPAKADSPRFVAGSPFVIKWVSKWWNAAT